MLYHFLNLSGLQRAGWRVARQTSSLLPRQRTGGFTFHQSDLFETLMNPRDVAASTTSHSRCRVRLMPAVQAHALFRHFSIALSLISWSDILGSAACEAESTSASQWYLMRFFLPRHYAIRHTRVETLESSAISQGRLVRFLWLTDQVVCYVLRRVPVYLNGSQHCFVDSTYQIARYVKWRA